MTVIATATSHIIITRVKFQKPTLPIATFISKAILAQDTLKDLPYLQDNLDSERDAFNN